MLYIVIGFLVLVILVQLAFRHPTSGIDAVATWRELQKNLSVKVAAIGGFLVTSIPVIDQMNEALPQIAAISSLHALTASHAYQTFAGGVAFLGILARQWRQADSTLPRKDLTQK